MKKLILPLLLALICGPAFGAIVIVQSNSAHAPSSATIAVTLTNPVTSGNTVVYAANCIGSGSSAFASITDDKGDMFPAPDISYNPSNAAAIVGHLSAVTTGPTVFTMSGTSCTFAFEMTVYELSGVASSPLDAAVSANISFGTSPRTHTYTAAAAGEFAVAAINPSNNPPTSITGWTIDYSNTGAYAHLLSPTIGSNTITMNFAESDGVILGLATYEAASGASCTNSAWLQNGTIAVPTAGTTEVWLKGGTFGTVDCSTTNFWQPKLGVFGAN